MALDELCGQMEAEKLLSHFEITVTKTDDLTNPWSVLTEKKKNKSHAPSHCHYKELMNSFASFSIK